MTREEAIKEIKSWDFLEGKELEAIGTLIPELKESAEDERIYKEIMEFFKMNEKMCVINNHYPKWIAWLEKQKENLEKQKEQKPFNVCEQCPYYKDCPDYNEKKQEWGEEDEANLDYLIDYCNSQENGQHPILMTSIARKISLWLYRLKSGEITVKRQANEGWSNDDEERFDSVCSVLRSKLDEGNWKPLIDLLLRLKTAYRYQRAYNEKDEKTIHLACEFIRHHATKIDSIGGIDCSELVERLKSIRPQPQSEWSEEDEHRRTDAIYFLESAKSHYADTSEVEKTVLWLKSLRPSWKPSEEQMRYLKKVYESYDFCDGERNALESLYEQLEKLM